jgi:phosphoserine phosphatase RsbU/P
MEIKLNSLLEVTKAINTNASTVELLDIFRKVAVEKLNIGRLVLFVNDNEWKCVLKFGTPDIPELNIDKDLTGIKEITYLSLAEGIQIPEFDVIVPVFHKATPLAYVLIGDLNEESISVSPIIKHLPFIQTLTNIIVVAIENKKLFRENIKQAAMQKELELASQMQSLLFPSSLPSDEVMDISAFYFPHRQVGGDYYDFVRLNENEIILCMADVSGKGQPSI